ncbi:MAG TPA: c-type cytochrome [Burkholderiales bacterium]
MAHRTGRWAAALTALFLCTAEAQAPGASRAAPERAKPCAACHGADGNSVLPGIPSIAGQPKVFIENLLVLTREGLRGSPTMQTLMHGVKDAEIRELAAYFSALPARSTPGPLDKPMFERGRALAAKMHCGNCHRPDYAGQAQMPRLAAQREDFLNDILRSYRDSPPPGSDTMMASVLYRVPDADLRALAHYMAHLK